MNHLTRMRKKEVVPSSGDDHLPRLGHFALEPRTLDCVLRRDCGVNPLALLARTLVKCVPRGVHHFGGLPASNADARSSESGRRRPSELRWRPHLWFGKPNGVVCLRDSVPRCP